MSLFVLAGCADHSVDVETFLPEPQWLDSVKAPALSSTEEVSELWRSKKRCCINKRKLRNNQREFYKACYVAVAKQPANEQLVTKCLQLMDNGMEPAVRKSINNHFVSNYFWFESPIDRCVNCMPADPIANASRDLAWLDYRADNAPGAIDVVKKVLDERLDDISPFVQMNLYAALAHFYNTAGFNDGDLQELKDARDRLRVHAKSNGASKHNFRDLERNIGELLER